MPGPWDTLMKYLIRTKPQHLVTWILKTAHFKERLSEELKVALYMDSLLLVEEDGQKMPPKSRGPKQGRFAYGRAYARVQFVRE